ncbi:MAG: replication-associated recombination protein A [Planctomycetota bacterium]|nr:replication-associated recombination protein A [Planctomycetota bacterium]MDA1252368.1 replication-associated recombination protein A [Planctomycetota bacterium]
MGLFDHLETENLEAAKPLAARMRPRSLAEFVGQEHFLGEGKLLRRILAADRLSSVIFYGPPGCGKTSLAEVIASQTKSVFARVNAASVGVKEVRELLSKADDRLKASGERTLLFIDELHHFNRTQQDVLLPDVESGVVRLIGATTENPFFSLVSPLVSRSQVFEFKPVEAAAVRVVLERALADRERGLGKLGVTATDEALDFLAEVSDGDVRRGLSALEIGALSVCGETPSSGLRPPSPSKGGEGTRVIDLETAQESIQKKAIQYDDDVHYDAASALIKSMRGSDPDAAVYWLGRMLEAGEDPRFLARRIVIAASEDVGNADPQALVVANAAAQATLMIGMPECRIMLSQAAVYVALAPKSNASYTAINEAMQDVRERRVLPVPTHLQDGHYKGAERLGHGEGYEYAHDSKDGWVDQDYLGVDRSYYRPVDRGFEVELKKRLDEFKAKRTRAP